MQSNYYGGICCPPPAGVQGLDVFDIRVILIVGRVCPNAPNLGLLRDQSLQHPPPSLRDTSAGGGH